MSEPTPELTAQEWLDLTPAMEWGEIWGEPGHCHNLLDQFATELVIARQALLERAREVRRLRQDGDEYHALITRQGELLTGVANAIKGEPDELTMHDWSDLPALATKAAELRASLLALMAEDDGTYEWCTRMAARVGTLLST